MIVSNNRLLKLFTFVFIGCLTVLTISSCKPKNKASPIDHDVIFSPDVETVLVWGEGMSSADVENIRAAYYSACRKSIEVVSSNSQKKEHEIIIGKTSRELSQKAYRVIEIGKQEDTEVGFAVYSDGKSIALAFDEVYLGTNIAYENAIEYFITTYFNTSTLKADAGRLYFKSFNPIETQKNADEAVAERLWEIKASQIASNFDVGMDSATEIITELQSLREIYNNDKIVEWLANLYDPETGGFYFSNSARNNVGYLPDLESTAQALGIIESILSGYGGNLTGYFGEEIANKFVKFAKDMQDPDNGYFYHPQWPRSTADKTRRSRDLLNALAILDTFSALPTYNTPNGVVGDGKLSDGTVISAHIITLPLQRGNVSAVSKLLYEEDENEIYIQPHLKTKSAFEEYLKTLDIVNATYDAAQALISQSEQIKARDRELEAIGENYRLTDILVKWISAGQYTKNWLWSKTSTYDDIYETSKVIELYSSLGVVVPNARGIFITFSECIKSADNQAENISDLANVWTAIAALSNNITTCGDNSDYDIQYIRKLVISNYAAMIRRTKETLPLFARIDGSFSLNSSGSTSEINGVPIALANQVEGNINATLLATKNIWLSIFNALNMGSVPIFSTSDRMLFQKTLLDMGVIIKNKIPESDPIDFDAETPGNTTISATLELGSDASATIVEDSEERGNVLNIKSCGSGSVVQFGVQQKVDSASCNILELDMCVLPGSSKGYFAQLYLYSDMYMIGLNRDGDTVKLYEESSRGSSNTCTYDLGVRPAVGEWFNLRVEYYVGTRDTVRIKIFYNGDCIAVTDNFFGSNKLTDKSVVPAQKYNCIRFLSLGGTCTDVLLDNVIAEQNYKSYVPETDTSGNIRRNIDAPDVNQKVHNFEQTSNGKLPDGFVTIGDESTIGVATDSDGNKYLKFGAKGTKLKLPLQERGAVANSALVDFYLTVDSGSAVGAKYEISFDELLYKERNFAGMQLIVIEENGVKYVTFSESLSKATGATYKHVKLPLGEKVHIRVQFFFNESVVVLFVENDVVGISTKVFADHKRYYMGEVSITNLTPSLESTLMIDNFVCERIKSDYEKTTAPTTEREIHTFDTLNGLDSSGVTTSGGVLTFANAQSDSYVKIPVNLRSAAATLGFVSLDVSQSGSKNGALIISLTDSSDNVIASLSLVPVQNGIAIYEYTKHGIYALPLYTVPSNSFTLSIEYSPQKENFNILVDGSYVASSSVTYSDNKSFELKALRLSSNGSGFNVDNVIVETMSALFKNPVYDKVNQDDTSSSMTYNYSSFAFLPARFKTSALNSAKSALRVKIKDVNGLISKVLEFTSSGDSSDSLSLTSLTKKEPKFNALAFETDLMIQTIDQMSYNGEFTFRSSSTVGAMATFTMAPGGKLTVWADGTDRKTISVKDGDWFKLRIEYASPDYDYTYDGKNDIILRLYINGELIVEGNTPYSAKLLDESAVTEFRVRMCSDRGGVMNFDNTIFEQFVMNYKAPAPADTHTLTYEPGVITQATKATLGKNSSISIKDMDVRGEVSKVLSFVSAISSDDKLSISVTQTLENANALSLETDIMILPTTDTAELTLEPLNANGRQPFSLLFTAEKGGEVKLSAKGLPETVIGNSGEWIHLKIEYMNPVLDYNSDGDRDILLKIYVDHSLDPIVVYTPYSATSYYDPAKLENFNISVGASSSAEILIDNIKYWQIELTPDAGGVPPVEKEDESIGGGGGILDEDGWV